MYLKIIRRTLYNLRDSYLIYILSSSFAVAVLTLLATLVNDPSLQVSKNWNDMFGTVLNFMVFIFGFFTFVYMAYVGGFFIDQQRQEFKTYRKLGMSRFAIAIIGFCKTFIIQILAWIIGMVVAVILQKFMGMLLVYLMRLRIDFVFFISLPTFIRMVYVGLYSSLILSVINGFRSFWITRVNVKKKRFQLSWFTKSLLGVIGLIFFIIGIILTVQIFSSVQDTQSIDNSIVMAVIVMFLYLFGTYFIFKGFLPLCLQILDKLKLFSYNGTNLFSFKYLRGRLIKNTSIIWFVTELSAMAVALLVFCYAGYQMIYQNYQGTYPFELASTSNKAPQIQKELDKKHTHVRAKYHSNVKWTVSEIWDYSQQKYIPRLVALMPYSEYSDMPNKVISRNPTITSNEFLEIRYNLTSLSPNYRSTTHAIKIKDAPEIQRRSVGSFFPYGTQMFSGFLMIVPDSYYQNVKGEVHETFYGWDVKGSDKLSSKFMKKLTKKDNHYVIRVNVGSSLDKSSLTKITSWGREDIQSNDYVQDTHARQASTKHLVTQATGFFLFIVAIFSIALLIALGSLLTLKVMLRDDYEWRQLQTLKKIGVTNDELKQIVRRETSFLFGISIIFTLIQSFVVVGVLNLSVNQSAFIPFLLIGTAYIVLYGLTGFLTFIMSWRGVRQKIQSSSN